MSKINNHITHDR